MAWQVNTDRPWNGATDGNWSTFQLRIGTPPQAFAALVSFQRSWLRVPFAGSQTACVSNRRGDYFDCSNHYPKELWPPAFEPCESTTVTVVDKCDAFSEFIDDGAPEQHDLILNSTQYLDGLIAGHYASADAYESCEYPEDHMATLGLLPRLDYTKEKDARLYTDDSLDTVKPNSLIQNFPAFYLTSDVALKLVYGYTAGAWYRDYPASLSLGSIVPARMGDTTLSFPLASFPTWPGKDGLTPTLRNMLNLKLYSVASSKVLPSEGTPDALETSNFLAKSEWVQLDPELPFLELPGDACRRMAQAFQLEWDSRESLYLVSNVTRARLRKLKPSITLTVGSSPDEHGKTSTLDIVLPYEAFEHTTHLKEGAQADYFPIRIAKRGIYILGRTFFQEAYVTVDLHDETWNLSRAAFPEPRDTDLQHGIVFIHRPEYNKTGHNFQGSMEGKVRWISQSLEILAFTVLLLFLIHVVLPSALAGIKYLAVKRRREKQQELWVALHARRWPHSRRDASPAETDGWLSARSILLSIAAFPAYLWSILGSSWKRSRYQADIPLFEDTATGDAHVSSPGVDGGEVERHHRAQEERQTHQIGFNPAILSAWENGKRVGHITTKVMKNWILPIVKAPIGLVISFSDAMSRFSERDAWRRAARHRQQENENMIDL